MTVRRSGTGSGVTLATSRARRIWMRAQGLDRAAPFGAGEDATRLAVEHLGYVQIDTINVIERCHHHILFSRIPSYGRDHLAAAQSVHKTVFEYWTHALAYVPVSAMRYVLPAMQRHRASPGKWFASVTRGDLAKVLSLIESGGPISIRDIEDDVLVEKDHPWASRKPSRRALQRAFFDGTLTVSQRSGMLKTYDLTARHFGWTKPPRAATATQVIDYLIDRALRAQGVISLRSACFGETNIRAAMLARIEDRVRRGELVGVRIENAGRQPHWARPEVLEAPDEEPGLVHILSPFDPLIIQRQRLAMLFGYDHRFEAYLPPDQRVFGYFGLPVLAGDRVVAVLDLKTDRQEGKLLVRKWTWIVEETPALRAGLEDALHRFAAFQLAVPASNGNGAPEGAP